MHPVYSKTTFGVNGVLVRFYNGSSLVNGYITRQIGQTKYVVTDGTSTGSVLNTWTVTLAQTSTQVSGLGSGSPTLATMLVSPLASAASGATFTATYTPDPALVSSTAAILSGGAGYTQGDTIVVDGGKRATATITIVTNPAASDTLTFGGTVITFRTSAATTPDVNLGGTNILTTDALYTMLAASADTNIVKCWYYHVTGTNVITAISRTVGTASNAITVATSVPAKITVPATLSGGTAAVAGTPSQFTVNVTTGVVTSIATIGTAGAWLTLPSGSVTGYFAGNAHLPVTLTLKFTLPTGTSTIATSGGTGYVVNDVLVFAGMVDTGAPVAIVSAVSGSTPTTINVTTAGTGITVAATSITVSGIAEHVKTLYDNQLQTVEGHRYFWSLGASINGAVILDKFV